MLALVLHVLSNVGHIATAVAAHKPKGSLGFFGN